MATETATANATATGGTTWRAGVAAGLVGSLAMGVAMAAMNAAVLEVAIPSLYGLSGGLAGFTIHMAHGAVLGVGLAAVFAVRPDLAGSVGRTVGVGLAYGFVLWVVLAALLMPVWLSAVGSPASPPFPNFNPVSLVWHLIYGGVAGALLPFLDL